MLLPGHLLRGRGVDCTRVSEGRHRRLGSHSIYGSSHVRAQVRSGRPAKYCAILATVHPDAGERCRRTIPRIIRQRRPTDRTTATLLRQHPLELLLRHPPLPLAPRPAGARLAPAGTTIRAAPVPREPGRVAVGAAAWATLRIRSYCHV